MKRFKIIIPVIIIIILVVFSIIWLIHIRNDAPINAENRKISPPQNADPQYSIFPISVYETDKCYIIVVSADGIGAEFSKDRQCIAYFETIPIKSKEIHDYLNKKFSFVEESLGKYHVDVGSGFFIPSYITQDGYLICFHVDDNYITYVQKIDLFTGEYVED